MFKVWQIQKTGTAIAVKKTGANQREGDTGRTSSKGRKEALGGGKAKKGNPKRVKILRHTKSKMVSE